MHPRSITGNPAFSQCNSGSRYANHHGCTQYYLVEAGSAHLVPGLVANDIVFYTRIRIDDPLRHGLARHFPLHSCSPVSMWLHRTDTFLLLLIRFTWQPTMIDRPPAFQDHARDQYASHRVLCIALASTCATHHALTRGTWRGMKALMSQSSCSEPCSILGARATPLDPLI